MFEQLNTKPYHTNLDFVLSGLILDGLLRKEFLLEVILALFCLLVTLGPSLLQLGLDFRVKCRLWWVGQCVIGESAV